MDAGLLKVGSNPETTGVSGVREATTRIELVWTALQAAA
jgi:hypothetical protein